MSATRQPEGAVIRPAALRTKVSSFTLSQGKSSIFRVSRVRVRHTWKYLRVEIIMLVNQRNILRHKIVFCMKRKMSSSLAERTSEPCLLLEKEKKNKGTWLVGDAVLGNDDNTGSGGGSDDHRARRHLFKQGCHQSYQWRRKRARAKSGATILSISMGTRVFYATSSD